jgi:hypothetical protein
VNQGGAWREVQGSKAEKVCDLSGALRLEPYYEWSRHMPEIIK